jgi:hypothetical protein
MALNDPTENLLVAHKKALNDYREWDEKVKHLLKGRRLKDLTAEDMESYREASEKRDAAYDEMRHLERQLLDNIPGASTGSYKAISRDELNQDED